MFEEVVFVMVSNFEEALGTFLWDSGILFKTQAVLDWFVAYN